MYQNRGIWSGTPPVVKNLILINVVMLLATQAVEMQGGNLTRSLGLFYFQSESFRWWQPITHMFMHGGWAHLFFNMFALWMFGRVLEQVWGPRRFLIYYFVTGLGAVALHTFVNFIEISQMQHLAAVFSSSPSPELLSDFMHRYSYLLGPDAYSFVNQWFNTPTDPEMGQQATMMVNAMIQAQMNIPTVGASGAVFGVLLAFGMLFPNTELMLLFPPIPLKAKYFVIGYGLLELFLGISQPGSNVAHFAHLGGMLFGFILIKYWNKTSKNFY